MRSSGLGQWPRSLPNVSGLVCLRCVRSEGKSSAGIRSFTFRAFLTQLATFQKRPILSTRWESMKRLATILASLFWCCRSGGRAAAAGAARV